MINVRLAAISVARERIRSGSTPLIAPAHSAVFGVPSESPEKIRAKPIPAHAVLGEEALVVEAGVEQAVGEAQHHRGVGVGTYRDPQRLEGLRSDPHRAAIG